MYPFLVLRLSIAHRCLAWHSGLFPVYYDPFQKDLLRLLGPKLQSHTWGLRPVITSAGHVPLDKFCGFSRPLSNRHCHMGDCCNMFIVPQRAGLGQMLEARSLTFRTSLNTSCGLQGHFSHCHPPVRTNFVVLICVTVWLECRPSLPSEHSTSSSNSSLGPELRLPLRSSSSVPEPGLAASSLTLPAPEPCPF